MTLLRAPFLWGALILLIPLLIHLLNRSRYKEESFGAMMFLQLQKSISASDDEGNGVPCRKR